MVHDGTSQTARTSGKTRVVFVVVVARVVAVVVVDQGRSRSRLQQERNAVIDASPYYPMMCLSYRLHWYLS